MNPDVRLGRIAGVEVAASWSLLVIVGLITWSLGAAVLPGAAPGAPAMAVWVTSAVTAVAFFACLLARELAHSVVARSAGMEVDGIVLWMFWRSVPARATRRRPHRAAHGDRRPPPAPDYASGSSGWPHWW